MSEAFMNEQLVQISERIRGLREIMEISKEEMATVTDLTLENYTKCEEGKSDFSFTFLHKCATRFGIDLSELVTGDVPKLSYYTIVRNGQGLPIERRSGFQYLHLASLIKHRHAEPFVVTAPYIAEEQDAPIVLSTHDGQEFNFILSGSMKFRYEDNIHILNIGDSVFYDSSKGHGMIATEGKECKFISVVIPTAEKTQE